MAKDLKVIIDGEAAKLERAFEKASTSTRRLEDSLRSAQLAAAALDRELEQQAEEAARKRAQALETLGRGLVAFGAATLAGLGIATKAAMGWETAWTGVRKVLDGTPEQFAQLEDDLRGLARLLPTTHEDVAAVAQAAGQLGIGIDDVAEFTHVMIDLGNTTNLSAEEASFAIARMANVMGTSMDDVSNLGSAIVDLGNNSATTEADIVALAQRIAGAGATIGLSEADVLGFAAALSSVGISAEAGGTAISRVMIDMSKAVAEGGEKLEALAEVAGMSSQQFATAFEEDPAAAIEAFVSGLGRVDEAGGNVFKTLDELGFGNIRVRDSLLRLSGAGDLLADSIDRGNTAWDENTALAAEAALRYDTAEAKIAIAKSTLFDLAIDVGGVLLPAFSAFLETTADVLTWFGDLPGPVKTIATVFGALIGSIALISGGFLLLAPRIAAVNTQMSLLATTMPRLATAMRLFTLSIPVVGILLAVASGIAAIVTASDEASPAVGDVTRSLLELRDAKLSDFMALLVRDFELATTQFDDLAMAAHRTWESTGEVATGMESTVQAIEESRRAAERWTAGMESADEAVAGLVQSGHLEQAAEVVEELHEEFGKQNETVDEFADRVLPGYALALADAETQQELAKESAGLLDDSLTELGTRFGLTAEEVEEAAQEMLDAWSDAFTGFIDLGGAYDSAMERLETAERERAEALAEANEDGEKSWQDFVKDTKVSMEEYLTDLEAQVEAQRNWADNMIILAGRVPPVVLDELARMGKDGVEEVELLVNASDEQLERYVAYAEARGKEVGDGFAQEFGEAGRVWAAIAEEHGQDVADKLNREFQDGKRDWSSILSEYGHLLKVKIPDRDVAVTVRQAFSNFDLDAIRQRIMDRLSGIAVRIRNVIPGFADGGVAGAGQVAWVGEEGPELVRFASPARVHSHPESMAMLAAAPASMRTIGGDGAAAPGMGGAAAGGGAQYTINFRETRMSQPELSHALEAADLMHRVGRPG